MKRSSVFLLLTVIIGLVVLLLESKPSVFRVTDFSDCLPSLGVVYGKDADSDGLAPKPGDSIGLFDDGSYVCKIRGFSHPAGYILIESEAEIGLDDDDSVARTFRVCVTPVASAAELPWELFMSDVTKHQNASDDSDWAVRPLASGVGTLCGNTVLVPGHSAKLNGKFETDSGQFWLYMADTNNVESVTVDGADVTAQVVNEAWTVGRSSGADGMYKIPKRK